MIEFRYGYLAVVVHDVIIALRHVLQLRGAGRDVV